MPSVPEEVGKHAIVALGGVFSKGRAPHDGSAPNAVVSARNSSLLGLLASVKSGSGLAMLPKGIGEPDPELVRVIEPNPPVIDWVYLLMHADLRNTPRFRAFFDFFVSESKRYRSVIRGETATRRSSG